MILVVSGRQQGKTKALIRWLLEAPDRRVVVVPTEGRRIHFMRELVETVAHTIHSQPGQVRDLDKMFKDQVVSAHNFFSGPGMRGRPRGVEVGVDNLEEVMQTVFQARVEFATANATTVPMEYQPKATNVTNIVFDEPKPRIIPVPYDPKTGRPL